MSRTGQLADFALLTQRDNFNYIRRKFNRGTQRWQVKDPPFTLDSLQTLYNDLVDTAYGWTPFQPDSFKVGDINQALREVVLDPIDPSKLDTNYSLRLLDGAGRLHFLDKRNLAAVAPTKESLMPGHYAETLTEDQVRDLVAFLSRQSIRTGVEE